MKHRLATMSETRVWAREVIEKVVADHVLGPLGCLAPDDLRELRRILYTAVSFTALSAWEKKILREEWRVAQGYPARSKPKMKRLTGRRDVMPAMREWALKNGVKLETETAAQS